MPQTKPAVKLTEKQWEVLERMEANGLSLSRERATGPMRWIDPETDCSCACPSGGYWGPEYPKIIRLCEKGLVETYPTWTTRYRLSPAGRAALAARRAEKDKVANG
jgi:DNA-binding PadR family transcriptional regulator